MQLMMPPHPAPTPQTAVALAPASPPERRGTITGRSGSPRPAGGEAGPVFPRLREGRVRGILFSNALFALSVAGLFAGCGPTPTTEVDWHSFEGKRAMNHVRALVEMGPHPSGSSTLTKASSYIASQLQEAGLEAEEQVFMAGSPRGPIQYRNVIAKTPHGSGGAGQVIIIASHYDTKYFSDFNFVGANDGGSSSGALLELARCAAMMPNVWFVFFDGEEAVKEYSNEDGLVGSRFFVEQLKADKRVDWIKGVILLDMVGDANLNITLPGNSTGKLVENVFAAARDVGSRDYFTLGKNDMLDDHVPFLRVGIPAVDLIDFEYGSAPGKNDYWHTEKDTLDKLSPRSLEVVGQTTLRLLARLRASL